ncbi:MAG: PQQ-binding-like beta-propeller repeat protein [Chitinivibrionales bacterium]|nr:PQQ-binding-like beta-propeller repeat protein [Chitinivibrionales bacterium]
MTNFNLVVLVVLALHVRLFAALDTLNALYGNGSDNQWTAGGANVGADCSEAGGTVSSQRRTLRNLTVPLDNEVDTAGKKGRISSLAAYVSARANVSLIGKGDGIRIRVLQNGWSQDIDNMTDELTTSFVYYSHIFTTDPITGTRWTWAGINSLEAGCRTISNLITDFSYIYADHVFIIVQYNAIPVVRGSSGGLMLVAADCFQRSDGTGKVEVNYRIYDQDQIKDTIKVQYWNAASWQTIATTYLSGDFGAVDCQNADTDRQILWNVAGHLGAIEVSTYNLRVIANDDSLGRDTVTASSLRIDTRAPTGYGCKYPINSSTPGSPIVTLESNIATDMNPVHYSFQIDDNALFTSPDSSGWLQEGVFQWQAAGLTMNTTYYWRVKTKDTLENSSSFSSAFNFTVSMIKPSVIIHSVSLAPDGTGLVTVHFTLSDPQAPENCKLLMSHSIDNKATWRQSFISGSSHGTIDNTGVISGSSNGQITTIATDVSNGSFVWDSRNSQNQSGSLNATEYAAAYLRITPEDAAANRGDSVCSLNFVLDNKAPAGAGCSLPANGATNVSVQASLTSSSATDVSVIQYYFELDNESTFLTPLQTSGWQSAAIWQPQSLSDYTLYYWRVRAMDSYGNAGSFQTAFSFTTFNALWKYPVSTTIGPCSSPCLGDDVVYVGTGGTDDKLYCINIKTGALKWSYQAAGDVKSPCTFYHESSGKYAVYFTTSDAKVYGLWDNGSSSSLKFTTVDLGNSSISEPMISVDGNYLYLNYQSASRKYATGPLTLIWQTSTINPSTSSAPVVDNDNVYFSASATSYKYTVDNTVQGSVGYGATTPLGIWNGVLYLTKGTNYVTAVNISNMTHRWTSENLGGMANTAVMWNSVGKAYVGAGNWLKTLNTINGAVAATYTAGGAIQSMPMVTPDASAIFFGCNDSNVYAVTAALQDVSGWPKGVGGSVQTTPAVDMVNSVVVFCSSEGKVYGFPLP